ncbi:MAG: hypothetical protein P8075_02090 [Deltaproteobacteria bacterium]
MGETRCSLLRLVFMVGLCASILLGCAILPEISRSTHVGESGPVGSCASFFELLDQRTKEAGALDPGAFRVKNYPYLRLNRFLASFRNQVEDQVTFAAWVDQMQKLDRNARRHEITNLAGDYKDAPTSENERDELFSKVVVCGDLLRNTDFQEVEQRKGLSRRAVVPDEYISLRRFFGLYPLSSLFVAHGVSAWHQRAHKSFSLGPPVDWHTIRYVPEESDNLLTVDEIISQTQRDALGIPRYSPEAKEALFKMYAPVWQVETRGDFDRMGSPFWTYEGTLDVDGNQPVTYTLLSYTRFKSEILTQLNYIIWFPSRPKESTLDIYGGLLDGLNYRVTLDGNGEPLLYESMHNCGCYYKSFPTKRLKVLEKISYAEPPLFLKAPELNPSLESMTVAMESRTHFVQHLYPSPRGLPSKSIFYPLVDYGELLSLPLPKGGAKSMFSENSIAPGSQRLERWILWPTGVLSPGAMRQWGRHAVAFVGKRHFDDPYFMEKMFLETGSQ